MLILKGNLFFKTESIHKCDQFRLDVRIMVFLLYFTSAVLLVMRAFNKRKHVVWGTVKSRDAVNSSNIISSPGQVFMVISPCQGNVIRRTLINDRLWITFFSMSLLVLHNEIKAIRPYDLSKPLIKEPRITLAHCCFIDSHC